MSPRLLVLARSLGLGVLCLGLSLGCSDSGTSPNPPPPPPVKEAAVDAAKSSVTVDRADGALSNGQDAVNVLVTVVSTTDGAPMAGRPVTVTVDGEGVTVAQAAPATDADGHVTAKVTSTVAGTKTARATVTDVKGGQVVLTATATAAFSAPPKPQATRLAFRAAVPNVVAGEAITGLAAVLQDANGATVTDATAEVQLALQLPDGRITTKELPKVAAVAGVATFPSQLLATAGKDYHFIAQAPGLTQGVSTAFQVVAGAPDRLTYILPGPFSAGVAVDIPVTVTDAYKNAVTQFTGTVTLSTSDTAATVPAAHVYTAGDAGTYTFKGLTLRTAGPQTLTGSAGTAALTFTVSVEVVAGTASRLVFTKQPASRVSTRGDLGAVEVQLKDASGNTVPGASASVKLAVAPQAGFTLSGSTTVTASSGVAAFSGLSVAGHGTAHLVASAQGFPDVSSTDIQVVDDVAPAKPVLSQSGATETSVTVKWTEVGDDGNQGALTAHELRYATSPITTEAAFTAATLVTTGAPGAPGSVQTVTLANLGAGKTYHVALKVSDAHGNSARSDSLPVSTDDPQVTQLVFATQPSNGVAGTALPDVRVELRDARGDVVPTASSAVTLSLVAQQGFNPVTVQAVNGVATFTGLRVDTAGRYTLQAAAGALSVQSSAFTVRSGPATKLVLSDFPDPVAAGIAQDVLVALTDAFDNVVLDYTGTVHFTSSDAQAVLPADVVFAPADSGQKSVSGVVFKTAGAQTLTATDTVDAALTATSHADVRSSAAASFAVVAESGPFPAGQALSYELVVRDAYGNVAKDFASTVTFTSTDAQAVLPGAYTFGPADEGRHTFSVELRTQGDQEVAVQDVADPALQATHTYAIVPAAVSQLVFTSAPTTGSVRQELAPVNVEQRDAYGNRVSDAPRGVTLALVGGSFSGGSTAQTTTDGIATFGELTVDAEGTYQFRASSDGLADITSGDLVITDAVAPAAAHGFAASALSDSAIRLVWTASGDDGDLGTADHYELRYATTAITDATFDSATLVTGVDAPAAPGSAEAFTVSGLQVGTTYHFALKTFDGAGNASALATASATTTNPCDGYVCTPPASQCAEDGTSLEVYSSVCVVQNGAPTCQPGDTTLQACPGANAVCYANACTTAPHAGAGELVLSEVMHTPSAGTTEYLELTNTTSHLVDANGLTVNFVDGVGTAQSITVNHGHALVVAAGGRVVLAQNANFGTNGGVFANDAWGTNVSMSNTGSITLKQGAVTVDSLTYTSAFPQTTGRAMSLASSLIGTKGSARAWYWCDSTGSLNGGDRGTPGQLNDDCGLNVEKPLNYCAIQYPKTFPSPDGTYPASISAIDSYVIFSQFYSYDVTTRNTKGNDLFPRIEAQLGYGTDATNPAGWTWTAADFNAGYAPASSNNDEMKATLQIATPGTYRYGFRYRFTDAGEPWVYCDQNGKTVPPAGTYGSVTVKGPLTNHVVISEFSGGTTASSTDEFVELYNPTNADVDLSGWQVSYKSATGANYGTAYTIPSGKVIRAHGYFLLGGSTYSGTGANAADALYSFDASASTTAGGHIRVQRLVSGTYVDVDKLGYGTGNAPEGTAAPSHPASGGSLERKAVSTSTSATMAVGGADAARGNGQDTDNNSADFVTRAARQPQNSLSALEFY